MIKLQTIPYAKHSNINEDFDIHEKIGQGSYSVCKRCVHKQTGAEYAVKVSRGVDDFILSQTVTLELLFVDKLIMFYSDNRQGKTRLPRGSGHLAPVRCPPKHRHVAKREWQSRSNICAVVTSPKRFQSTSDGGVVHDVFFFFCCLILFDFYFCR